MGTIPTVTMAQGPQERPGPSAVLSAQLPSAWTPDEGVAPAADKTNNVRNEGAETG